jgi:hypothetical protein
MISTYAGGAPPPTPAVGIHMSIGSPQAVASDAAGDTYFISLNCIFKIESAGTVTRIAGIARPGYSGDGAPAAGAQLSLENRQLGLVGFLPPALAGDVAGNVFVADNGNARTFVTYIRQKGCRRKVAPMCARAAVIGALSNTCGGNCGGENEAKSV